MGGVNIALLMKKAWRITRNPHLLLSKVYNGLRHHNTSISSTPRQFSWGCRSISFANKILNDHCIWKVGNGATIGISTHKWLIGVPPLFRDNTPIGCNNAFKSPTERPRLECLKINKLFEPTTTRHIQSIELPSSSHTQDSQYPHQVWRVFY